MEPSRALLAASPANRIMPTCFRPGWQRPAIHPTIPLADRSSRPRPAREDGGSMVRVLGEGISSAQVVVAPPSTTHRVVEGGAKLSNVETTLSPSPRDEVPRGAGSARAA
jgi:hypothetical protein